MKIITRERASALLMATAIATASTANAAAIESMTIVDVTGDTVSGAFRFGAINFTTYNGSSCFNSNGETITGCGVDGDGAQIPGAGTDGAILFGQAQGPNAITPGFIFFTPFQPVTTGAPEGSVDWNPLTSRYELTMTSLPWAGFYNSTLLFPLAPDAAPTDPCTNTEIQSGGICVRFLNQISPTEFEYSIRWNHIITAEDDPSGGSFVGFNARWALEGVLTVAPAVIPVPATAWLLISGLAGLVGIARRRAPLNS